MTKSLVRALYKQRLNEYITIYQFANEMQTSFPRHVLQEFMNYAYDNKHREMYRYMWLEVFVYWKSIAIGTRKDET